MVDGSAVGFLFSILYKYLRDEDPGQSDVIGSSNMGEVLILWIEGSNPLIISNSSVLWVWRAPDCGMVLGVAPMRIGVWCDLPR